MEIVKQLALFLENKPGALLRISKEFAQKNINIQAISISDSVDYAVVRLIVDKPMEAIHMLGEVGVLVVESDLIKISMTDKPGELASLCQKILDLNVNIEYAYGSNSSGNENFALYIRVMNPEQIIQKLKK